MSPFSVMMKCNRFALGLWFPLLLLSAAAVSARKKKIGNPLARSVRVMNDSGSKIDLFWIHPDTHQLADSHSGGEGVMYGGETGINSYVGHAFEVDEMPVNGKCLKNLCRKAFFTVNKNEDQCEYLLGCMHGGDFCSSIYVRVRLIFLAVLSFPGVTIDKDFGVTIEDSATRAQERAQKALGDCRTLDESLSPQQQIDAVAECLQRSLERELNVTDEEISFQAGVRKEMGQKLKEYTCVDTPMVNITTTASVENTTWSNHDVKVLFASEYSSVRLVEGFLSPSQCDSLLQMSGSGAVTPSQLSPAVVQRLRNMMSQTMQLPSDYYTTKTHETTRQPQLEIFVDEGATVGDEECEVQADGSCLAAETEQDPTTPTTEGGNSSPIRSVTVTDDETILGRLLLLCRTEDTTGGLIFFPKTGVRIAEPASGDAVLILYQTDGMRDEDPFLDEHMTCPIRQGKAVTLEEVYHSSRS